MLTDYRVSMVVEYNLELNNVITEMLSEKYKVIAASIVTGKQIGRAHV